MKCRKKIRTITNTMLSYFFYINILVLLLTATAVVCAEQPDMDNETLIDENYIEKPTPSYLEFFKHQDITKQRSGLEISEYDSYVNTESSKEIEDFQQQIYNKGYNYTVAENGITQLTPEERERLLGYKPIKPPTDPLPVNVGFHLIDDISGSGMVKQSLVTHPSSYDAMALGYVTQVRDQGACGSCWIFGPTANLESSIAIREGYMLDLSEQEVGDCNIWTRFCNGGSDFFVINYLTKKGITDEFYNPYVAAPQTCFDFPLLKKVDNWRIITGDDGEIQISKIKDAILNYGSVSSTIYTDRGFGRYSGGVYEYWGTENVTHMIQIIGWDDSKPHSHGTGAWLIKNSWGTDWAIDGPYPGCAWVAYGSANLGDYTSSISGYSNASSQIYYHDEYGWIGYGSGNNTTTWGAVRFTPTRDSQLESVDFWAVDANMSYEIMIFDNMSSGSSYAFSNQLGTTQTGSTDEMGYYSIRLNTPVLLTKGDDFIVQVRFNATTSTEPVPIDYALPVDWCYNDWKAVGSGESYISNNGTLFSKLRINGSLTDIGVRARTSGLEYGDAPDPTYPTLSASDGARHNPTDTECIGLKISNGDWKETEPDARVPNSDTFDDGLRNIPIIVNNSSQTVTFEVTDILAPSSNLTVNILIDLNRDGDWNDPQEHAVVNQKIITTSQEQVVISQPFSTTGASQGPTWLRITLTRHNISNMPWNGTMAGYARTIPFEYGETEDWKIYLIEAGDQHVCNLNTGEEFLTIQAAIDAAGTLDGHTISIDPGTYYETVNVNKQLTIRSSSEDPTDTIIDAFDLKDHVINVAVDNVNISGLTVTGAINSFKAGIYLGSSVDHCNISNNKASNNYYGILMESSSNNKFTRNTIEYNNHDGIYSQSSNNNTFIDNFIKMNKDYGICIGSSGNNNFINNIVKSNYKHGIYIKYSSNNNIFMNNTANSNYFSGIFLRSSNNNTLMNNTAYSNSNGIYLSSSSNNMLMNNTANLNKRKGICLGLSGNNTLTNNTMSGNKYNFKVFGENLSHYIQSIDTSNTVNEKPIYYWVGQQNKVVPNDAGYVAVVNSTNITIRNPTLTNNYEGVLFAYTTNSLIENFTTSSNCDGIFLDSSCNNTIKNNIINSINGSSGIYMKFSSNNTFTNNTISSNGFNGISLYYSNNNSLTNNIISLNEQNGIWLGSSSNNSLTDNTINSNKKLGIWLSFSSNNSLTNNTINSNKYDGVWLDSSSNNSLTNNTMSGNKCNFGVIGNSLSHYTHEINTSNKVEDKPIYYWVDQKNQKVPDDAGFVGVVNSTNITIRDQTLTKNIYGVLFAYTSDSLIENITVSSNYDGIRLQSSNNNTLRNNTALNNSGGICLRFSSNNTLTNNTMSENMHNFKIFGNNLSHFIQSMDISNTVDKNPVYYWVDQQDKVVPNDAGYVGIINSTNITVSDLALTNNYVGVLFAYTTNSLIENITASLNNEGISLISSSNNTLINNIVNSNEAGICLGSSSNNTIINTTADSNDYSGIILFYSNDNLIYNNYFNNKLNAIDENSINIWNINKTAGKNIIGGSWLGGNYWSDYEGKDTDGDGLGDTLLPHRSSGRIRSGGDYHPLVQLVPSPDTTPPVITNITNGTPTTDSITIIWDTDENSNSLVRYGTVQSNYTDAVLDTVMVSAHNIMLSGLSANTTYYFVANSTDASNNSAQSEELNFTTAAATGPSFTTVSIENVTLAPGESTTVPIMVNNVDNLGGCWINLTYNASVVHVSGVLQGDMDYFTYNIDNGTGWMTANALNNSGLNGDIVFANIELTAVGIKGEETPLDITVIQLIDTGFNPIYHTVIDGTFIIEEDIEAPAVTDASASPDTILNDNDRPRAPGTNITTLSITVTDAEGDVANVTIDLTSIGGSADEPMIREGETDVWSVSVNAVAGINLTHHLTVNATDNKGNFNDSISITLTVLRRGDVCRNNVIDNNDVIYIARYLAGLEPECSNPPGVLVGDVVGLSGDAEGDSIVDLMDALYLARNIAGLEGEP